MTGVVVAIGTEHRWDLKEAVDRTNRVTGAGAVEAAVPRVGPPRRSLQR
jgi:hypothetical protein